MQQLASLWIGDALGPIERASARSFLAQGNCLTLYAYGPVANVPEGVRLKDAREILGADQIIREKKTGSPALHSDIFRYALMEKSDAIWVDLDIIALRPFNFPSPYIFGYETETFVNGAVLHLPKNSKTLQALLKYKPGFRSIPPYLTGLRKKKYQVRAWLAGGGIPIEKWPWGALGPRALTYFLRQSGEIQYALSTSAFYAIALKETERFLIPGGIRAGDIPADAWAVHLWGKDLRKLLNEKYHGEVPAGSFLSKFI